MGELTEKMIGDLAEGIAVKTMKKLALGSFDIGFEALENMESKWDAEELSRNILRRWKYLNRENPIPVKCF